jgi:hypothetical protein
MKSASYGGGPIESAGLTGSAEWRTRNATLRLGIRALPLLLLSDLRKLLIFFFLTGSVFPRIIMKQLHFVTM